MAGFTWHPERDGFGTLLEAEKTGVGTYAEGYRIERLCISLEDARAQYGTENVTEYTQPSPVTVEVQR